MEWLGPGSLFKFWLNHFLGKGTSLRWASVSLSQTKMIKWGGDESA